MLDAQSKAILDAFDASGVPPLSRFQPSEAREKILALRVEAPPAHEMWKITEEEVTVPDGSFTVRILVPRPPEAGEAMPVVIYFHGGGFVIGDLDQVDAIVRQIASQADCVVVNVDYRLAPEAKFPAAPNGAYAALCWVHANAGRLGLDPERVVLCGDSAGGNLAIVASLMARDQGGPAVCFHVPLYPGLDCRSSPPYPSRQAYGGGEYFLSRADLTWFRVQYLAENADELDWRASPILAKSYAGLPPALIVTAGFDPLVDEGRLLAERYAADGVRTEYKCFESTIHGFVSFAPVLEAGASALDLVCGRIRTEVGASPKT